MRLACALPLLIGVPYYNAYSKFTVGRLPLGVAINLRPCPLPTLDTIRQLNRFAGDMPWQFASPLAPTNHQAI